MLNIKRVRLHKLLYFGDQYSPELTWPKHIVTTASLFAIFVGGVVLLSWCFQLQTLSIGFLSVQPVMNIGTALCLIMAGLSLCLLRRGKFRNKAKPPDKLRRNVAYGLALMVNVLGIVTLIEVLLGDISGIHHLYPPPWRTSLQYMTSLGWSASLGFTLVGRALMFLSFPKTKRSYWYAQVLALIALVIALQAVVGYAYAVEIRFFAQTMSVLTAFGFAALCAGILAGSSEYGLMRLVTSNSYSGWLARRLLGMAIVIPLLLGWVILQGHRAGVYDPGYALALFAILLIVTFTILIWQSAASVEYLRRQCDRAYTALKNNEAKLRGLFEANVIGIVVTDLQGNIRKVNDEWLKVLGYSRGDVFSGRISWQQITPPEYADLDRQKIQEATMTGVCKPYEKEYFRSDGSRVPVLVGYTFIGESREELVAFVLDLSQQKAARHERKQVEATLRQVEQKFWLAVEHIPDVFVIYDAQRRWQFVNQEGLRVTGKSRSELIGHTDEEIFSSEVTDTYLDALIRAQQTGDLQTTEAKIINPQGEEFTHHIKFVPILNENGQLGQILAFHHDITASKQVEMTLRNQHQWQEELLNLMPTPLLLVEPGTAKVTFANRAADGLAGGKFPLGRPAAEYHTIFYCTDGQGNRIPDEKMPGVLLARGHKLDGYQMDWHTTAGIRSLLIYGDTLPAMYGHQATGVMIYQDISQLKQAEKGLSLGYKRLQLLFSTASDLLSNQHPSDLLDSVFAKLSEQIGLDIYVNYLFREAEQQLQLASYTGVEPELIATVETLKVGEGICGLVAQEHSQMALEDVLQSEEPRTAGIRRLGVNAFASYPLLVQGRLMGTLGFGSRQRHRFSQNELGMMQAVCDQIAIALERTHLVESLQSQTEQLQAANRMKDEFLAVISHELRSPLNAILGWSQLLLSRPQIDLQKQTQGLAIIERNARVQKQLIEDLLDISRIIRGKLRLKTDICNLIPIVQTAVDTVRLAAEAKEIDLKLRIDDTNPAAFVIIGDSDRLQQVTWNLLTNAIKFTPMGGCVEVILSTKELDTPEGSPSSVQIQVRDTGIGISPEFIPYVFDRFRQADSSSTRHHGGMGLGLAIVRHLVELHGGTVEVDSAGEGAGACFTVSLPLLARRQQKQELAHLHFCELPQPPAPLSLSIPSLEGIHVLVVEDEVDTREFVAAILQNYDAIVTTASSVVEALTLVQQSPPDVLISDIGMPEEDGYSLIRKIRNLSPQNGGQVPAAALTAYSQLEDRMRILQSGYQLHIPKPVEAAELVTIVASLANRRLS